MSKWAIIVAGGTGKRMGAEQPKQFLEVGGQPIIIHTLQKFIAADPDIRLIIALPKPHFQTFYDILEDFAIKIESVVGGGETRFHSVKNALADIADENGLVAVHDAVRPCVSVELIQKCFKAAEEKGAVVPVVPLQDSMRKMTNEGSESIDRSHFRIVQTPQVFDLRELKMAYEQPFQGNFTDDASVLESAGKKIHLLEGEPENIKITAPVDLKLAELLLR